MVVDNKCIYEHRQNCEVLYTCQLKLVMSISSVLQIVVIHTMICESHFTYNLIDDIESCLMMTSLEQNGGFRYLYN